MKLKIRKGDTVQVTAGTDKGLKGTVLGLDTKKLKIRVQGVAVKTNFDKEEGITKAEGFIDYSNVKLVEKAAKSGPKAKKATARK